MIAAMIFFGSLAMAAEPSIREGDDAVFNLEPGVVTLDELLKTARDRNPGLQAAMQAAEAAKSMISPARALPDPTFTFQHMGDLVPPELQDGDPSSARTFGITQEFPFPGKRGLQGEIASVDADIREIDHLRLSLKLAADIKQAYYDLAYIHRSIDTVQRNQDLLRNFVAIAQTRYQVGQGVQQDVIKAQVEVLKLRDQLIRLDRERKIIEARLNELLYLPVDAPVGVPAGFEKAELTHSLPQLIDLAKANSPTLRSRSRGVDREVYGVELARKEFYPDFALGFTYFERGDIPEMYGLMLSIELPVYSRKKQGPELRAALSGLKGAKYMLAEAESGIYFQIREAYVTAVTSEERVNLYDSAILPQARLSLESAVAGYKVGNVDFLTLVDNVITLLDYELNYHEAISEFQKALARIEPIVGRELTGLKK